jgi:DMSO reductase iron-sulfur subunit
VLEGLKELEPGSDGRGMVTVPALGTGEHYRFHFDMRRCIGCRSCEVACNEQNNNPAHVKWRRVGEIEGGSYPHVQRFHLSMACNHCLEPSCLEGCPVDAYAKLENGIVSHDAETCIGCQYCTWTCPYGAPQYHPERRVVTKCNLCAERMAGGHLPACVEACPTQAIQIEVVDAAEWRRTITGGSAPGMPPPDLTLSTTRISLPDGLPESFGGLDAALLEPEAPHWPLVFLLVLSQWSVGLFALALVLEAVGAAAPALVTVMSAFAIGQAALAASVFHLGRPLHALRALRAWRRSWLSREALFFLAFAFLSGGTAAIFLLRLLAPAERGGPAGSFLDRLGIPLLILTVLAGIGGVVSSAGIYLLPARPAWNGWRTPAQFFLTAAFLGSAAALEALLLTGGSGGAAPAGWGVSLAALAAGSALAQALVPWVLAAEGLATGDSPVRGAALLLVRRFGRLLRFRTFLLLAAAILAPAAALLGGPAAALGLGPAALLLGLVGELAGRYLFFVTVVPRNIPGHFFSRRPGVH